MQIIQFAQLLHLILNYGLVIQLLVFYHVKIGKSTCISSPNCCYVKYSENGLNYKCEPINYDIGIYDIKVMKKLIATPKLIVK